MPFHFRSTGPEKVSFASSARIYSRPIQKADPAKRAGPAYYRVLVDVTDMHLRGMDNQFQMIPGMAVTAEMKTGDRSVISYFLYPLLRGLDEGMREP